VPTIARTLFIAALALAGSWAAGQTVYRCGSSYGTQPCAGGTVVDTADPRTGADAARATKVSVEDAKRADAMEKARLAQEKNAPKAIVILPKEPPTKPQAHAGEHAKDKKKAKGKGKEQDPDLFTATAPGEGKKASKAK
jgi:hypothetical protein